MTATVRCFTLATLVGAFAAGPLTAAENLAVNGGFEQARDGAPEGWRVWSRKADAVKVLIDPRVRHGGKAALHVTHTGEKDWAVSQSRRIDAKPGDLFAISARIKCSRITGTVGVSVVVRTGAGKTAHWLYGQASTGGTHDWKQVTSRFIVPEDAASLELRITGSDPGEAWFDDVTLTRTGNVDALRGKLASRPPLKLSNRLLSVSIDPRTGAMDVTDKRTGRTWSQWPARGVVVVGATAKDDRTAQVRLLHAADGSYVNATVVVSTSAAEFTVTLTSDAKQMQADLDYPPSLRCAKGDSLVVPLNEGILYPVDDAGVRPPRTLRGYAGHGLSMPFYGVTDGKQGILTLIETPDDMLLRISRDQAGLLSPGVTWQPSRAAMRYPRKVTYVLFDRGGYVAQAKEYRKRVKAAGRFRSMRQKLAANPNVDLLIGAPDVWAAGLDQVKLARELKSSGVERALFSLHVKAGQAPDLSTTVKAVNALGYLCTRYDSYRTAWKTGEPPFAPRHIESMDRVVKNAAGRVRQGWMIKTKKGNFPGYEICSLEQVAEVARVVADDVATTPYRGRFMDTTTAAALMECYDPKHPLSRSEDRKQKVRLLEIVSKDNRLVAGTETGQDWAAPVVHYFEGMMSLTGYRVPDSGRNIYAYHEPTEDLLKYQVGPRYRVPLWELVYHDSVVAYWYWGDGSNKQPELWDVRDLWNILYATPPLWMITRDSWARDRDRFVRSYRDVCPAVRKAGYREMLDHQYLTPDRTVQQTTFAGGLTLTVNFGKKPHKRSDGRTVAAMGFLVEGD